MSVVLMYHALYEDEADLQRIDPIDRPYAVSMNNFREQLDIVARMQHGVLTHDSVELPEVVLTFDDGHLSNFDRAFPLLVEREMSAYFFVTTDFIQKRSNYCEWAHLARMSDAGMIIGGHGQSHRFFEDLTDKDAVDEFCLSKQAISEAIGQSVTTMSFPGGRYSQKNLLQAREAGYSQIFGSKFGTIKRNGLFDGAAISRLPIRIGTTAEQFKKLVTADPRLFVVEQSKTALKHTLKKTLGNKLYHGLYKSISQRR